MTRDGVSLLEALREELGVRSVKDGCSPQGQCGCCTVLVDGSARVACVTPIRRVAGRSVTTSEGLDEAVRSRLVSSFTAHGASQCGFCTPGIICRLAGLGEAPEPPQIESALLAHLCRCTGWRSIIDAATDPGGGREARLEKTAPAESGASERASMEGGVPQRCGSEVVMGRAGFSDDTAPDHSLVAVPDGEGGWCVSETLAEARASSGKLQGRRSGGGLSYPIDLPPGDWDVVLQTTWVEPAYLEPDASWCAPGGEPHSPVANGGAFGGKLSSLVPDAARSLAETHRRPVRVVLSREDVVRLGPKRPPVAAGIRRDGTGVMRVAASTTGLTGSADLVASVAAVAPGLAVEFADVTGPPVSYDLRAAGWAEAAVLVAAAGAGSRTDDGPGAQVEVTAPSGGWARARVAVDPSGWPAEVDLEVECGPPLDEVTLRSYLLGATHMALGWVCSEAIAVDPNGIPEDLTIRSFGILRAKDTPPVTVSIRSTERDAVPGSDAAFASVAAATWLAQGLPWRWPTRRGTRR